MLPMEKPRGTTPPDLAESDTGPVLVVVRYQVPEQRRAAFLRAPDLVLH